MTFVSHVLGFGINPPGQIQVHYPTIVQQPMIPMSQPQFLLTPQVQYYHLPVITTTPTMVAHPPFTPPSFIVAPAQPSVLPPGTDINNLPSSFFTLRIVFYGHPSDDYTPPLCLSSATYKDSSLPSRDALLAGLATWAGHHGLSIRHPGGRIDPLRVKLYVLPRGNALVVSGMDVVPGVGLVVPGDVVRVVRMGGIEERDWEEALREIKREGYEAVVAVDMGVSVSTSEEDDGGLDSTTTTTATDTVSTPAAATDGDQAVVAAAAAAAAAEAA
ncbi:hypothetical protein M441DRAFT_68295 [Trichoderma asperellum CBS 433.97]|uniref:Uncharacterized protein n=2 Tax=Trichoderma asperellum TaxID=101201 RepID=A0A2T3Z8W8_TRIA4|nr:hypothetical protein M441DRAFT_68295 [Trichoderma asperellum CBS 433.97]PTB41247.1 hypothetical protein M441DRAFT_68295 [Trichoderma asperellum CBS 433.97]